MFILNILAISDIHGHKEHIPFLKEVLSEKNIDIIIICGDITNFGTKNDAIEILYPIKELGVPIFSIPGNCDQKNVLDALNELNVNLHENRIVHLDKSLYGFGGSNITPFGTPFETEDELIYQKLKSIIINDSMRIFVFHAPPYNTKLDYIRNNHVGSKSIRRLIEEFSPKLALCGHLHEARGIDQINETIVVNPGVFGYGEAAIIQNEKEVEFIYI